LALALLTATAAAWIGLVAPKPASCYTVSYGARNLTWKPTETVRVTVTKEAQATSVPVVLVVNGSEVDFARLDPARILLVDARAQPDGRFADLGLTVDERAGNDVARNPLWAGPYNAGVFYHSFIYEGTSFRFCYPTIREPGRPSATGQEPWLCPGIIATPGTTYVDLRALTGSVFADSLYLVIEGDKHGGRPCQVLTGSDQWEAARRNTTLELGGKVWEGEDQGLALYLYQAQTDPLGQLQYLFFPATGPAGSDKPVRIYGIQVKDVGGEMLTIRMARLLLIQFIAEFGPGESAKQFELLWSKDTSIPQVGYPLDSAEFYSLAPARILLTSDGDGDGLSDIEPIAFGTDPTKADTDGDKIPDASEVYQERTILGLPIGRTSPYLKDTDKDLLGDHSDPVPTTWYLPWFPVLLILSCTGVVAARYLYERIYLLRAGIREAYQPVLQAAAELGRNIEMTRSRCEGIDLEMITTRYKELEDALQEQERKLGSFNFRELSSIMGRLEEFKSKIQALNTSLHAKALEYIQRDLDMYKRNLRSLRDRGFEAPPEPDLETVLPKEPDISKLLDQYEAVKATFDHTIGEAISSGEQLVQAISTSIDKGAAAPQVELARREFDERKPKKAVEDLTKAIDAIQQEYAEAASKAPQEAAQSCTLLLETIQQIALDTSDQDILSVLEKAVEKIQPLASQLQSLNRLLDLPRALQLRTSLLSEASQILDSLDDKARSLETTLQSSSPPAYPWQVDLELRRKVQAVRTILGQGERFQEAVESVCQIVKHLATCISEYLTKVTVLRSYPQIEPIIERELRIKGSVGARDLPVNYPDEFLKIYQARHPESTNYDRSDRALRRRRP